MTDPIKPITMLEDILQTSVDEFNESDPEWNFKGASEKRQADEDPFHIPQKPRKKPRPESTALIVPKNVQNPKKNNPKKKNQSAGAPPPPSPPPRKRPSSNTIPPTEWIMSSKRQKKTPVAVDVAIPCGETAIVRCDEKVKAPIFAKPSVIPTQTCQDAIDSMKKDIGIYMDLVKEKVGAHQNAKTQVDDPNEPTFESVSSASEEDPRRNHPTHNDDNRPSLESDNSQQSKDSEKDSNKEDSEEDSEEPQYPGKLIFYHDLVDKQSHLPRIIYKKKSENRSTHYVFISWETHRSDRNTPDYTPSNEIYVIRQPEEESIES
jgi:hypothetical protein